MKKFRTLALAVCVMMVVNVMAAIPAFAEEKGTAVPTSPVNMKMNDANDRFPNQPVWYIAQFNVCPAATGTTDAGIRGWDSVNTEFESVVSFHDGTMDIRGKGTPDKAQILKSGSYSPDTWYYITYVMERSAVAESCWHDTQDKKCRKATETIKIFINGEYAGVYTGETHDNWGNNYPNFTYAYTGEGVSYYDGEYVQKCSENPVGNHNNLPDKYDYAAASESLKIDNIFGTIAAEGKTAAELKTAVTVPAGVTMEALDSNGAVVTDETTLTVGMKLVLKDTRTSDDKEIWKT